MVAEWKKPGGTAATMHLPNRVDTGQEIDGRDFGELVAAPETDNARRKG
jgi:hypothetical protein